MRASAIKFTYQDYVHIPEDRLRHEIIDGDHYVTPAPTTKHQWIAQRLLITLGSFVEAHRLGKLFHAPTDVVLSDINVVQPDLLFISRERLSIITEANIQGAPDLIIEILSPSTADRDRTIKRTTYARFGVTEYWIVSPDTQTIEVCRLQEPETAVRTVAQREALTSSLFPGLELALPDIFHQ